MSDRRDPAVIIVGAGMSGIGMAATLLDAGFKDITILEKGDDVGGTWRDNHYPGLSCDVPSRFYRYSFARNPRCSHLFSPGAEIQRYFADVADTEGIRDLIRFSTTVTSASFVGKRWTVRTDDGSELTADFLIAATGILRDPAYPDIPGLEDFEGPVMHSARWDDSVDLYGKRVAVIGTGSTGVQIVCGLEPVVSELLLFQRSAHWVLPLPNPRYSSLSRLLHERVPVLDGLSYRSYKHVFEWISGALTADGLRRRALQQACRASLLLISDPELRKQLTPDFEPMCRRLIISSGFFRAIQQPHVRLVTDGIEKVLPGGIVTAAGRSHEIDAIVLATGFDAHAFMRPMSLTGADGTTIGELWERGPVGYLGVSVPHFPNFFMLMGPHSPVGNYPLTAVAESQARHIRGWLQRWRAGELDSVAPRADVVADYNEQMRAALPGTVWSTGCSSWYLGDDGVPALWPWTPAEYHKRLTAEPDLADYVLS